MTGYELDRLELGERVALRFWWADDWRCTVSMVEAMAAERRIRARISR